MTKKIFSILMLTALFLTSCNEKNKQKESSKTPTNSSVDTKLLIGNWINDIVVEGKGNEQLGIIIKEDGIAESINMATLVYKKWWLKDNSLTLVAESIGNHTSSIDTTTYNIDLLNNEELHLKKDNYVIKYKKLNDLTQLKNADEIVYSIAKDKQGNELKMYFNNSKSYVTLNFKGESIELYQQVTGSGIWYKNDIYELTGKGENVELKKDGKTVFKN